MYRKILDISGVVALIVIAVTLILLTIAVYSNKFNYMMFWGSNSTATAETCETVSPPSNPANGEENGAAK